MRLHYDISGWSFSKRKTAASSHCCSVIAMLVNLKKALYYGVYILHMHSDTFLHLCSSISSSVIVSTSRVNIQSILKQISSHGDHLDLPWASFSSYLSTAPVCLNGKEWKSAKLLKIIKKKFRLVQIILYNDCMQHRRNTMWSPFAHT